MTDTDVTFLQYYRSCLYIRHDLYLPFIPASLQTLGRVECVVACAPAPPDLRTVNPLILTLFSQCLLDAYKKLALSTSSRLPTIASILSVHTHLDLSFLLSFFSLPPLGQECFLPLVSPSLEFASL
jgi:hypothetical protein